MGRTERGHWTATASAAAFLIWIFGWLQLLGRLRSLVLPLNLKGSTQNGGWSIQGVNAIVVHEMVPSRHENAPPPPPP